MLAGTISKVAEQSVASTTTIAPQAELIRVTGSTDIATITPPNTGGFAGLLFLVPVDSDVNLLTTGNVAIAVTCAQSRLTVLAYSPVTSKWYPGAIS